MVFNHPDYNSWWQVSNTKSGTGSLRFYSSTGLTHCEVPLRMHNRLWFIEQDVLSSIYRASAQNETSTFIASVNGSALHALWHHRLGHPGDFITTNAHKSCNGIPNLTKNKHPFFACGSCAHGKMTKMIKGFNKDPHQVSAPGERFVMDFGFVCGSYKLKTENGPLVTSKDGFNSYLLIMDVYSHYMWVSPLLANPLLSPLLTPSLTAMVINLVTDL